MKKLIIIIFLITSTHSACAQSVDFELIRFKGLSFFSSQSDILDKFGEPEKSYDPNYDCGFLSTESQDGEFLTLDYGKIKFTGNEKELYVLEQINLENDSSIIVKYGDRNLTCETNLNDLIEIFGNRIAEHFKNDLNGGIVIFHIESDDGIRITIKEGNLIRFEYWSPC